MVKFMPRASDMILTSNLKSKSKPNQVKTLRRSSSITPFKQGVFSSELRKTYQNSSSFTQRVSTNLSFIPDLRISQSYGERSNFHQIDDIPSQVPNILSINLENIHKIEKSSKSLIRGMRYPRRLATLRKLKISV